MDFGNMQSKRPMRVFPWALTRNPCNTKYDYMIKNQAPLPELGVITQGLLGGQNKQL